LVMGKVVSEDGNSIHNESSHPSIVEGKRNTAAVSSRYVRRDKDFQGTEAFPSIGFRLGLTTKNGDDVSVVNRMTKSVDGCRLIARVLDLRVFHVGFGEFPMLDFIDRYATDSHGSFLTNDADRSLEILRIGKHGDAHGPHGPRTPFYRHHSRVLDLNVACERRRICLDAFDGTDQPVEQVDVMARLVHECTAIEFPRPAPLGAVVIRLGAVPEDVHRYHVDSAEPLPLDGALQKSQ